MGVDLDMTTVRTYGKSDEVCFIWFGCKMKIKRASNGAAITLGSSSHELSRLQAMQRTGFDKILEVLHKYRSELI